MQVETNTLMALQQKQTLVAMLMFSMVVIAKAAPTVNDSLPGQPLTDTGKTLNIPHLQLTGEVINHLAHDLRVEMAEICRLHPCSLWTPWSKCKYNEPGKYGQYGSSKRSRNCGFNTTLCKRYGDRNMEHEQRICKCKDGYEATKHGYCLKYFGTSLDYNRAKAECHKEGGFLASSDSAKKMEDMDAIMTKIRSKSSFWVDGHKTSSSSKKWTFENPPEELSFGRWYSHQTSGLCKRHYHNSGKWCMRDYNCRSTLPYMCEILT